MWPVWLILAAGGGVLVGYIWRMLTEPEPKWVVTAKTRNMAWSAYQTMKTLVEAEPKATGASRFVLEFLEDVCLDLQLIRVVELTGPDGETIRREVLRGS